MSVPPGHPGGRWRLQSRAMLRPQSRPYLFGTSAPCVLAWLAFRAPATHPCDREER